MNFSDVGRLAADPEIRFFVSGRSLAEFTLAIDSAETAKDENGKYRPKTVWLRCKAWGDGEKGVSHTIANFCQKGDQVFVRGSLVQDEWVDKTTDTKRREIKLNVSNVKLLPKQKKQAEESAQDDDWADDPKPPKATAKKSTPNAYASTASKGKALAAVDGQEELADIPY